MLRAPASRTAPEPGGSATALEAAIAEVKAGRRTTPLVSEPADGSVTVTLLARSADDQVPPIVSDVTGWGENAADNTFDFTAGRMTRVGRTDWYSLDATVALGARVEYLVAYGQADYRLDPHNPRQTEKRGSLASEFVTSGYVPPPEFADAPVAPGGRTTEAAVRSRALGGSRRVIVHTPPGYREDGDYALAVFHQGLGVAERGEAPRVLDWLIAHQAIEPVVAVFVESTPQEAGGDDSGGAGVSLRTFLAREPPAWAASRYGVTRAPARRAIIAISYGAKDAFAAIGVAGGFDRLGLVIPGRRLVRSDLDRRRRPRRGLHRGARGAQSSDVAQSPGQRASQPVWDPGRHGRAMTGSDARWVQRLPTGFRDPGRAHCTDLRTRRRFPQGEGSQVWPADRGQTEQAAVPVCWLTARSAPPVVSLRTAARSGPGIDPAGRRCPLSQPDALKQLEPWMWSPGAGIDVWEMLHERRVARDQPDCGVEVARGRRLPLRVPHAAAFAVCGNHLDVAAFLLDHGAARVGLGDPLRMARDRGHTEMEALVERTLAERHGASDRGVAVATALRARNVAEMRRLLDEQPGLVHEGDERSNLPIHWAVMTRQLDAPVA